jgi:hypothetical protein
MSSRADVKELIMMILRTRGGMISGAQLRERERRETHLSSGDSFQISSSFAYAQSIFAEGSCCEREGRQCWKERKRGKKARKANLLHPADRELLQLLLLLSLPLPRARLRSLLRLALLVALVVAVENDAAVRLLEHRRLLLFLRNVLLLVIVDDEAAESLVDVVGVDLHRIIARLGRELEVGRLEGDQGVEVLETDGTATDRTRTLIRLALLPTGSLLVVVVSGSGDEFLSARAAEDVTAASDDGACGTVGG